PPPTTERYPLSLHDALPISGEAPMTALLHHTPMANITGQPALSAPCGFSTTGLPIGYQLIGRPFAEATLFRLARAYERNHSWERSEEHTSELQSPYELVCRL